jgi:ubiquinone biosynthesis protein COQ4
MFDDFVPPLFHPLRAGRALAALLRDPDDLPRVFDLIYSISGFAPHRLLRALKRTEGGARLLRERPDIMPLLADRTALRALPDGSLGRRYLAFVESEGITPEGIKTASEGRGTRPRTADFEFLNQRMRDTHDLWHTVTGYKGDVLGEISLLAFTLAQHWNTGVALIVAAGLSKGFGRLETGVVRDGYRRGREAAWLPAQDWEAMLPLPLDEVRRRLKLGAPPEYTPMRSSELRAMGMI